MSARVQARSLGYALVKNFNPEYMDFLKWLNSFEYTVDLMLKVPHSKVEILLEFLEPSVLSTLLQNVAPANVKDLSYDEIICHLEKLYSPFQGEEAASIRLIIRDQFVGESVFHYMNALLQIAKKCNPSVRNSTNLINRLRRGLIDEDIRKILNDSDNLTFSDALMIAEQLKSQNNPN